MPTLFRKNSQITECLDEFSPLSQETSPFDVNWSDYNQTYTPNTTFLNVYNSFQYTDASQTKSAPYIGKLHAYTGSGYVFAMTDSSNNRLLQRLAWIDKQTAAVFVEFTLYNPNVNLYQACVILFEFTATGSLVHTKLFSSVDLSYINALRIATGLVYLLFICLIMCQEIRDLNRQRLAYYRVFYNYIDFSLIGCSWSLLVLFMYRLYASYGSSESLKSKCDRINLQSLSYFDRLFEYFVGFCAAFASLRFVKLLRFQKRVVVFMRALRLCLRELISFGLVFAVFLVGFVQLFYILLGDQMSQFSTVQGSLETCFQMMLGQHANLMTETFASASDQSSALMLGVFVYAVFIMSMVFVLINILVTHLVESYSLAKEDIDLDKENLDLVAYLRSVAWSMFGRDKKRELSGEPIVYQNVWESWPKQFDAFLLRIQKIYF